MSETVQPGPDDLARDAGSRPPVGPNPRRWLAVAIAAVVMLAVVAVAVLAIWRQRGLEPAPPAAGAAPTTTSAAAGQALRVPDTLGDFRRLGELDELRQQLERGPLASGELVLAGYEAADGRTGVILRANRPSVARGSAQKAAELHASNPVTGGTGRFTSFPRDGLDIRCATRKDGAVCYLEVPDLEAVLFGSPSAPRLADLLAEAYRKLG
jgi:hypothetical protein